MVMILICIYYSQFSNNWQALKKYNSMDTRKRRFMYIALGGRRELEKTGGGGSYFPVAQLLTKQIFLQYASKMRTALFF